MVDRDQARIDRIIVRPGRAAADRRLADAGRRDALTTCHAEIEPHAVARNIARALLERGALADELAARGGVGLGQQRVARHFHKVRIAVERVAVGERKLRALDHDVDEIRALGIGTVEAEALRERQLLQHHRALAPEAALAQRVAAILVGGRRFDARLPARHVVAREHAAMALAA